MKNPVSETYTKTPEASGAVAALAGNPNVGKSTVFNALTGMRQHTGNWPGKTVSCARGVCRCESGSFLLVDLPGCYSLTSHSAEEEIARDFICFEKPDAVVAVCDATCLERNLILVLQTLEITSRVIVCVNLMDEAAKKKISVDVQKLSEILGVPVCAASARSGRGLDALLKEVVAASENPDCFKVTYEQYIEDAVTALLPALEGTANPRWAALRLIEGDEPLAAQIERRYGGSALERTREKLGAIWDEWSGNGITLRQVRDDIARAPVAAAEVISAETSSPRGGGYSGADRAADKILTGKWTSFPVMLLALTGVLWLTVSGANYPSALLSDGLLALERPLLRFFELTGIPQVLADMLVCGGYRTLAWIVSVMLPPMAIFFPLFTLLEDVGVLPRVAFNLDRVFKKCRACGKQALTMCMGLGCSAAGVTGCRIIDSPRERLIAIITNSFVPCNGKFPTLVALISMFFVGASGGLRQSAAAAAILTGFLALGAAMTLVMSTVLSRTVLRGVPSSFALELPPYRRPQIIKVATRSIFDRTLFVLGRAAAVAAPAGLVIWIMANVTAGGATLLAHCSGFLDPAGRLLGMDGVILLAFILGFPANEIVLPIIIMAYMSKGGMAQMPDLAVLRQLFADNGWTWTTAVCVMVFSLMHWPCSTTCLTIKKETGSLKWTALAVAAPTAAGVLTCLTIAGISGLLAAG